MCRYSRFELTSNQTEKLFFLGGGGHLVLYVRTSMFSLCICLLQFLTHKVSLLLTLIFEQCMYRCGERLRDWDKYRQELCFVAKILHLNMMNKNEQLPAISKLIISLAKPIIIIASKYLSHFGCHSRPYQMAHAFARAYFKLTFNGTVIFRQPSFCHSLSHPCCPEAPYRRVK